MSLVSETTTAGQQIKAAHTTTWTAVLSTTDLYILDAVPPVHVVWNNVDADKLTTGNGGTFTSSSASLINQSR